MEISSCKKYNEVNPFDGKLDCDELPHAYVPCMENQR